MTTTFETNDFGESVIVTTYADGTVIRELDRVAIVNPVPQSVSMRQARLALFGAGLLSAVEAAISAQAEPTKSVIKIEWDYATSVDRNWPTLLALRAALGLTDDQLDQLFITAVKL